MGKHLIAQEQIVNTKMKYAQIISLEYFTNIQCLQIMELVWKSFGDYWRQTEYAAFSPW